MPANPDSILDSVKQVLGIDFDYTAFDIDVLMFTNMAFGSLQQLGVGAVTGFVISDNTTLWSQYISNLNVLSLVKPYVYLAVRLAFDPPATSFGLDAVRKQIEELTFRINVAQEAIVPPSDRFAVEELLEASPPGATLFPGGVMDTWFAPKVVYLTFKSLVEPDAKDGNVFYLTMTGDCTLNAPVNAVDGEHVTFGIKSAGFHLTWGNGWNFGDAGLPTLTSGKIDIVSAVYRESDTEWLAGFTPGF